MEGEFHLKHLEAWKYIKENSTIYKGPNFLVLCTTFEGCANPMIYSHCLNASFMNGLFPAYISRDIFWLRHLHSWGLLHIWQLDVGV